MTTPEFVAFPKMGRFFRDIVITEKLDGTNSSILITEEGDFFTGSRTRWITPGDDNYGFSRWAHEHKAQLMDLGPGHHFGEWWGSGIQRGYGLEKGEKRFSLFNTIRWCLHGQTPKEIPTGDPRITKTQEMLPKCVGLVPVLYRGPFDTARIKYELECLKAEGSKAAPGFRDPEGIVVFHIAGNVGFKYTLEGDGHKGEKS